MVLILGKTKEGRHKRQQDMYSVKCFFRVTSSCCFNEYLLSFFLYFERSKRGWKSHTHRTTSAQQHGFVNESDIVNEQK